MARFGCHPALHQAHADAFPRIREEVELPVVPAGDNRTANLFPVREVRVQEAVVGVVDVLNRAEVRQPQEAIHVVPPIHVVRYAHTRY